MGEIQQLVASWEGCGCPNSEHYGLTVRKDGTHLLWLDQPDHNVCLLWTD